MNNILPNVINSFFKFLCPNLYKKINFLLTSKYSSINPKFGMAYYQYEATITSSLFLEKYSKNVLTPLKQYLDNYANVPYFFVDIPFYTSEEHEKYFSNVKKQFDKQKIQFYDLLPIYKFETGDYDINIYQINPSNGHPGTKTTEFSARKVLEILENNYQNILGQKTDIRMNDIIINDPMPRNINLQKINYDTYTFNYPSVNSKNSFLYMPINEKYIKLNFMYPVDLKNIEITGDNINNIDIYINKINEELGYDDQKMHHVTANNNNIWNINYNQVTSINLHIDIKNGDSSAITIKFIK